MLSRLIVGSFNEYDKYSGYKNDGEVDFGIWSNGYLKKKESTVVERK